MKKLIKRSKSKKKHKAKAKSLNASKLKDWSTKVRSRDGYICLSCGSQRNTHAHHMVSKYYRPQFAYMVNNGITLCKKCHIGSGGVHHKKSTPRNKLISKLRTIYKLNDIRGANNIASGLSYKPYSKQNRESVPKKGKVRYRRYLSKRPRSIKR